MSIETFTFECFDCSTEHKRGDMHEVEIAPTAPLLGRLPGAPPMLMPSQPMSRETVLLCGVCMQRRQKAGRA